MASGRHDKFWTAGTLKSRGWTDSLMRELLPPPRWRHLHGRRIRMWSSEEVLAAEDTPAFKTGLELRRELAAKDPGSAGQTAVITLFSRAWAKTPMPETRAGKLALRYHEALMKKAVSVGWSENLRPGKITGYLDHFLYLEKAGLGEKVCSVLRRFSMTFPWLSRNEEASQAKRLFERYAGVLLAMSERILDDLRETAPEADVDGLLNMEQFPVQELLSHPLNYVYSVCYVPQAIRTSLGMLMALNPRDEYPEARAMKRHFTIHIGGTNTGKTYAGFQRLKTAATGVYLAPLRLLALEAQEILLDAGVPCSLTTGEEEDTQEGDTHVAATAEKLDLKAKYDVAVIDECQMIEDLQRGYAWTRAILGVQAPEIHLCAAPQAKELLIRIIKSCGDTFEVQEHQRKTPLLCMTRTVDYDSIQPGDALITFSKVGVLSTAEDLRQRGKKPAIIYGALPYATRRKQVEGFLSGQMQYVVATDAIGMGLNLPIRRIIFMETEKFDGIERRPLKPEEIQQIAGRAGRYGMYDKGYVGAMENLPMIHAALETVVPPLEFAVVGFSDLVLTVDFDLLEVLEVWNRMPTVDPYRKLDVSRYITVISRLREHGFRLTKAQELRAGNIPYDETDPVLDELFRKFLRSWYEGEEITRPELEEKNGQYTLPELEEYCRKLDLYFSFAKNFGCPVDQEDLSEKRQQVAEEINRILLHNLKNNIRFCGRCGAALPLHQSGRLCNACFQKLRRWTGGRPVGQKKFHN